MDGNPLITTNNWLKSYNVNTNNSSSGFGKWIITTNNSNGGTHEVSNSNSCSSRSLGQIVIQRNLTGASQLYSKDWCKTVQVMK